MVVPSLLQSCVALMVLASCGMIATWRSDSALSSESSKNARQWHFIRLRAHQMASGGVVAHSSRSELSPQFFPFLLQGRNLRQRTACG